MKVSGLRVLHPFCMCLPPWVSRQHCNGEFQMSRVIRVWVSGLGTVLLLLTAATGGAAQLGGSQVVPQYWQQISANPFGILLEFFNAEFERVITESATVGVGGSYFNHDDDNYFNGDIFGRFYLEQQTLEGWAFGAKIGLTTIADHGTFFGMGFDLNRSWLMGKNENFYIGAGFGLKRLFGAGEEDIWKYIPTIRIVNVGIAF
jgi:hypothetical protein